MPRYVPKTYNNRRVLRVILWTFVTIVLSVIILFLILFFVFSRYVVDGQLEIPWLDDPAPVVTPLPESDPGPEPESGSKPESD